MTPTESRILLETALTNGGLRVLPAGAVAAPSVFVVPGSPWMLPSQLAGRRHQILWAVVAVAGLQSETAIEDAERLADKISEATRALPKEWGLPHFDAPGLLLLQTATYYGFRALIQTVI